MPFGRADAILNTGRAYRSAMIAEHSNKVASGKDTTLEQRASCRLAAVYAGDNARGGGSDAPPRRHHVVPAQQPPRRVLARPATSSARLSRSRWSGTRSAAGCIWGWTRAQVCANQLPRHGVFADAKLIIDGENAHV